MAHIVMCWELGADLGHVARLKPLAEALRKRGHQISFILRETLPAERLLDAEHYRWLQAPYQTEAVPEPRAPTRSFADMLHNLGFDRSRSILARLRAWHNLFEKLKPDLLVFDHSPTALLAARKSPARRMLLGTGFGILPASYPLPPFDAADVGTDLQIAEDALTA